MVIPEKIERSALILIVLFVILSAGIVTIGYLYHHNYEKQYRKQVEEKLSAVAKMKSDELVQYRNERVNDGLLLMGNTVFTRLVRSYLDTSEDIGLQTQLRIWLSKYPMHYQYDGASLIDTEGVVRMQVPTDQARMASVVLQRVPEALRLREIIVQDFYRNEYDQRVYLTVLVPIIDNRRPVGVLTMRIDPTTYLYPFMSRWPSSSVTAESLLVRREGNEVVFLNELKFQENTAVSLRITIDKKELPAVQAVLGRQGIVEGRDYRGVPVIAYVRAIPDSPWFLVARMDTAEVYAPVRERLWMMVILVGALLLGSGSAFKLVWRRERTRFYREKYETSEALLAMSSRQEAILAAVPDIVIEVDANRVYTWANQAGKEFFGDDVVGREAASFFEGEQDTYQVVKPLFDGSENTIYLESWQRRKDGEKRLLAWWCRVVKDKYGEVTGALSTARDITDRMRAQEALRESEERYRILVENIPQKIFTKDRRLVFVSCNLHFARDLGIEPEEIAGKTDHDFFPKELAEKYRTDDVRIMESGVTEGIEEQYEKDGEMSWVYTVKTPIRDEKGNVTGILGVFSDITERKRAEEKLRYQQDLLQEMGRVAKIGAWEFDVESGQGTWTDEVAKIHGLDPKDETNMERGLSFYHGESRIRIEHAIREAVEFGRSYDLELELFTTEGVRKWVQTIGHPVFRDGKVVKMRGSFQDITERKQAEEEIGRLNAELEERVKERTAELEAANKELEAFAYSVSHDLRAPLRAIDGFSRFVLEDYAEKLDDEGRRLLNVIRTNSEKMDRLISDILRLSRSSRTEMKSSRIDMTALVHSVYQENVAPEEREKITFSVSALPDSFGDPTLIRQAWTNLITNAIKYTLPREMRRVDIEGRVEEDMNVYCIKDTGVGFNPDYAHKLFGLFQRLHSGEEFEGTGVGLAIAQRVIHRHGGKIWGTGRVNEGARFCFSLPMKKVRDE